MPTPQLVAMLVALVLEGRKILVVEDDSDIRALVRSIVAQCRASVLEARTGEEAMRLARQARPDAIVLDLRLPGASGIDVLRQIQAEPGLAGTPAIVVSSFADRAHQEAALDEGAVGYVVKPFRRDDLVRLIATVLDVGAGDHSNS